MFQSFLISFILLGFIVESHDPENSSSSYIHSVQVGYVNYWTLNDQQRMEMLVREVEKKYNFINEDEKSYEEYLDVCEWYGVICNDDADVIEINWRTNYLGGSMDLS